MDYIEAIDTSKLKPNSYVQCIYATSDDSSVNLIVNIWYDDADPDYECIGHMSTQHYPNMNVDDVWGDMKAEATELAKANNLRIRIYE